MKKQRTLISILIFAFFSIQIYSQISNSETADQEELELILKKCAEYCERLENASLYFICKEEITEEVNNPRRVRSILVESGTFRGNMVPSPWGKNMYIYDYQLISKENSLDEQRILINENSQGKNDLDAQLKTTRFYHKFIVFGPISLLSQKQQKNYEYKILKNVTYKKEKAVVLEALPKFPQEDNVLYGKIWIRKKDFAVLKIEWNPELLGNFEEIVQLAEVLNFTPKITFISEYGFEENKIRFPNKYSVEEIYIYRHGGTRFIRSQTTVNYDNYKFFTVDTKVKY